MDKKIIMLIVAILALLGLGFLVKYMLDNS